MIDTLFQGVKALILGDLPWMGNPALAILWEAALRWALSYVARYLKSGVTYFVIDLQTSSEENNLSTALKQLIIAHQSGDSHAVQKAIADYSAAQSALARAQSLTF